MNERTGEAGATGARAGCREDMLGFNGRLWKDCVGERRGYAAWAAGAANRPMWYGPMGVVVVPVWISSAITSPTPGPS